MISSLESRERRLPELIDVRTLKATRVTIETGDGSNPLATIEAFTDFTRDIGERCAEPPVAQSAETVGSYGVF